jgi:hypothetical protein
MSFRVSTALLSVLATIVLAAGALAAGTGTAQAAGSGPCDIYTSGGTPYVAAHSTTRALFGALSWSKTRLSGLTW